MIRPSRAVVLMLLFLLSASIAWGQFAPAPNNPDQPAKSQAQPQPQSRQQSKSSEQTDTPPAAPGQNQNQNHNQKAGDSSEGEQTKRMMYVVPNFAAVSAYKQLPPLSVKSKFWLATEDSFDYSSFVWSGVLAFQSYELDQYPELGTGMAGYSRYYWRNFTDGVSGTYFTEAIVPVLTHEDPRYYTMESGIFFHRLGYALSRTVVTKRDSGGTTFNFSEVGGNACEAALSNLYYPPQERGVGKTFENWGTQMESAALNTIAKEFWPDFRRIVLRRK